MTLKNENSTTATIVVGLELEQLTYKHIFKINIKLFVLPYSQIV